VMSRSVLLPTNYVSQLSLDASHFSVVIHLNHPGLMQTPDF
jgi:hypothetical protein